MREMLNELSELYSAALRRTNESEAIAFSNTERWESKSTKLRALDILCDVEWD